MSIKVNRTATGTEPITLAEAKAWLRIDDDPSEDDTLITSLITQARELVENYLGSSVIESTVVCEATPRLQLLPPYGPVISITSVKDEDGNDVEYLWDGFYLNFGTSGSFSVTSGYYPVYTISTYTAGYSNVPEGLKMALNEVIAYLYENRGEDMTGLPMLLRQNTNLNVYREKIWV